jgi:hypothetical protein
MVNLPLRIYHIMRPNILIKKFKLLKKIKLNIKFTNLLLINYISNSLWISYFSSYKILNGLRSMWKILLLYNSNKADKIQSKNFTIYSYE